jgi:hypothetical protein
MAAPSRPQAQRNGRFLLRRIVDTIRATLSRGHTTSDAGGRPSAGRDLEQQTVQQLRKRAREAGVQGRSSLTKDQLIKALRDHR